MLTPGDDEGFYCGGCTCFFMQKPCQTHIGDFFSMDALIKCCRGRLYLCVREDWNKVSDVLKNLSPACCFVFQQSLLSCIV